MLRTSAAVTVALGAALLTSAPAAAQSPPVFAAPQVLANEGRHAVTAMGPAGDVIVAWAGTQRGVFAARRAALGGRFATPVQVSDDRVSFLAPLRLARNDRGDVALAWIREAGGQDAPGVLRVALAAAGTTAFGPPEDAVSAPSVGDPALAIGDGGEVALAFEVLAPDGKADAYGVLRPAGGPVGRPALLGRRVLGRGAQLAAGPGGTLHALWVAETSELGRPATSAAFTAEASPGSGFGAPRRLSDPALTAGNGYVTPQLVANRRGDLLAAWAGSPPFSGPFQTRADVATRPAGGDWSAAGDVAGPHKAVLSVSPVLNDRGDAVVSWGNLSHVETIFRPAGGAFGGLFNTQVVASPDFDGMAVALDALGIALIVRRQVVGHAGGPGRIHVLLRARAEVPGPDIPVSGVEEAISSPAIATDPFGNGIVVWSSGGSARPVTAVAYSATAPVVARVRAGSRELRFRANEPANVRITVRRDVRHGKSATQTAVARPGANNVRYVSKVRALLRRKGRYVATIRARDAGPRSATVKLRFRRR
ncbi:MAG: hypothetical protein Q8K79_10095 [Solirubrobacteraceae bacterium]|nr:hypothetical protein [Solirubrobacteraceae bacterium]